MTFDQWLRSKKRGVVDEWEVDLAREAWAEAIRQYCRELFKLEPDIQAYRNLLKLEEDMKGEGKDETKTKVDFDPINALRDKLLGGGRSQKVSQTSARETKL